MACEPRSPATPPRWSSSPESDWVDIGPQLRAELGRPGGAAPLRDWSLALTVRGIAHELREARDDASPWAILTPAEQAGAAIGEILGYERENVHPPPRPPPAAFNPRGLGALWVLLALVWFHFGIQGHLIHATLVDVDWRALGSANASEIFDGEWWRLVTALTLHADELHLLANVLFGAYFFLTLTREIGSGLGWVLILLAGIAGNLLNSWAQGPQHDSLGASTAVFAAVGALGGLRALRGSGIHYRRAFVPIAAAVALLGLLGTAGSNTDLGAHLFGFLAGMAGGAAAALALNRRGLPGKATNRILSFVAAATPVLAWAAALHHALGGG